MAAREAHTQSTSRGDSTDFIETLGEAHDFDDRKGGSRVRSVRLFKKSLTLRFLLTATLIYSKDMIMYRMASVQYRGVLCIVAY